MVNFFLWRALKQKLYNSDIQDTDNLKCTGQDAIKARRGEANRLLKRPASVCSGYTVDMLNSLNLFYVHNQQ